MSLDSYANLKTALAAHLDRSDLTSYLDDFIDIAEAMHARDVRIREMLVRDALIVDARQIDLPDDCLEIVSMRLLTTPVTVLEEVNLHEMNRLRQETTGRPYRFTIHQEIEFDVTPSTSYEGEVIYYEKLAALSSTDTTNALLEKAPDLYLYGALLASAPFLLHDERIQVWGAFYKNGLEALKVRERSSRRVGPLVSRVAGATP